MYNDISFAQVMFRRFMWWLNGAPFNENHEGWVTRDIGRTVNTASDRTRYDNAA